MQDIVSKIKAGNVHAFKIFFDDYYANLCTFATRYIKDDEQCKDVVQEAFIDYWEKRDNFDALYKIKSYLYTSVRNSCLNILRHEKVNNHYTEQFLLFNEEEENFEDAVIEQETYLLIQKAIKELPPQMRRVIILSMEGLKNGQIAEKIGIKEGTVKALKQTAYQKLRFLLREHIYALTIIEYFF